MTEIIYTLIVTHITIICVTLFLHRGQAHRGIEFHPILSHFMRFWLWLTTGMVTKEWVAVHRKHHSNTDKPADPPDRSGPHHRRPLAAAPDAAAAPSPGASVWP